MGTSIFTDGQLRYILRQHKLLSVREIASSIGIKESQVRYILRNKLKISLREVGTKSRIWSESETEILSRAELTDYEKVKLLPTRTDASVRIKRRRMGFESKEVLFSRQFENNGYVFIRKDGGYECRNRVVAEKKIGRKLREGEIVHHINGIKTDDRPENLFICTRAEHNSIHSQATSLIYECMGKGYAKFDEEKGRYVLCTNL